MSRARREAADAIDGELDRIEQLLEERESEITRIPWDARESIIDRIRADPIGVELAAARQRLYKAESETSALGSLYGDDPEDRVRDHVFRGFQQIEDAHLLFVLIKLREWIRRSEPSPETIELQQEIDAILEEQSLERSARGSE